MRNRFRRLSQRPWSTLRQQPIQSLLQRHYPPKFSTPRAISCVVWWIARVSLFAESVPTKRKTSRYALATANGQMDCTRTACLPVSHARLKRRFLSMDSDRTFRDVKTRNLVIDSLARGKPTFHDVPYGRGNLTLDDGFLIRKSGRI